MRTKEVGLWLGFVIATTATSQWIISCWFRRLPHAGLADGYAVSLALVVAREIRIHRALPDGPLRADRLALLAAEQRRARQLLHTAAGITIAAAP